MLFRNRYRVESPRRPGWDYTNSGFYFVTVCTRNRECLFGDVIDGAMILNAYGQIAHDEWKQTFAVRRTVLPDAFVIMPNHVHGIIHIVDSDIDINERGSGSGMGTGTNAGTDVETPWHGVSTDVANVVNATDATDVANVADATNAVNATISPPSPSEPSSNSVVRSVHWRPEWKPGVLGAIVAQFKIQVSKQIRRNGLPAFAWQPRFHDHIIRNDLELFRIRRYICNNPAHWHDDEFTGAVPRSPRCPDARTI